jgi:threonine aldolase
MICGDGDFIDRAREYRKLLGGAMRQAGVVAAAGLVALEQELPRLGEDHEKAQRLARTLSELPGISLDLQTVQTNIVKFAVRREDLSAPELCRRLGEYDVKAGAQNATEIRFVTHRDQSLAEIETVCEALRSILTA